MSRFTNETVEGLIRIKCPEQLDVESAQEFSGQTKAWLLTPTDCLIIDFTGVVTISREFYKAMIELKTTLKREDKSIYSIHLQPALVQQITRDGLELTFNSAETFDKVLAKRKMKQAARVSHLETDFVKPFLAGVLNAFDKQCRTKVKIMKPYMKTEPIKDVAIASVINLHSTEFSGHVGLCFSQEFFLKLYKNMVGEAASSISSDNQDAAAELLNMIYGHAKTRLNKTGFQFNRAFPKVMVGAEIETWQRGSVTALIIPFESDIGTFQFEIEFAKTTEEKCSA